MSLENVKDTIDLVLPLIEPIVDILDCIIACIAASSPPPEPPPLEPPLATRKPQKLLPLSKNISYVLKLPTQIRYVLPHIRA